VGNQYLQAKKPWTLVKGTDEEKYLKNFVFLLSAKIIFESFLFFC